MSTLMLRSFALVAGLALSVLAHAVTLSGSGIGQALIYPYYTVDNSQDTLISVVNPTATGKAIQVRFLEGYDGRDVLDLVLFLAPNDVWTAAISQTSDDGGAKLTTADTSCTLPAVPADGLSFTSGNYDGTGSLPDDGGPHDIARTREGSIDFIVGGDVIAGSPTDDAIEHVADFFNGTATDCAALDPVGFVDDLATPTNGIYGAGTIIDVGVGTLYAYNADALTDFTSSVLFADATAPPPSLADANTAGSGTGTDATVYSDQGKPLTLTYQTPIDAVSAVFMADTMYNEYITAASLGAKTDWVVTFPTKRFYVDPAYTDGPLVPFEEAFAAPGQSATSVATTTVDREEGFIQQPCTPTNFGGLCGPPIAFLFEVNVVPFFTGQALSPWTVGTPSGVLGSHLTPFAIDAFGDDGHAIIDLTLMSAGGHELPGGVDPTAAPVELFGLPADGFMVYDVINTQAQPGLLANYGGGFAHRTTVSCQGPASFCTQTNTQAPQ